MRARLKPLLSWLLLWLVAAYWPGQAKQAAAQSLTINGKTATTAIVGDTLKLVYTFLQGMQVGFGEVWLDLDGDSTLSQGDQLLYQTIWDEDMLIDGEANDEDGAVDGKFETTITDFIWLAPAGFVFIVIDGVTQTEAYLELLPLTNGPTIEGEVTLPRNVKDLVVFVTPIMGDGPPDGGDQPPFPARWVPDRFLPPSLPPDFQDPSAPFWVVMTKWHHVSSGRIPRHFQIRTKWRNSFSAP